MKLNRRKIDINKIVKASACRIWKKYDKGVSLEQTVNEELDKLTKHTTYEKARRLLFEKMEVILKDRIRR